MVTKTELEKLKKTDLVQAVLDIQNERMSLLGEGECFVRKAKTGFAESVKVNVALSEAKKHIYSLGNKWCISVDGYDKLNQAAGLSIINPPTIHIGGSELGNPHFDISPKGGVRSVTVRRVVMGPSPIGNLVAIERLLRLDLNLYFLEDLQHKVKNRAGAGGYGTESVKPASTTGLSSTLVPFGVGPAVLWVDMSHPDIQEAFGEHIKRCKYAERIATRICERNALASHPAIAVRNVEPVNGVAEVSVFGGKAITDEKRIKEITEAFAADDQDKLVGVEVVSSTEVEEPALEEVLKVEEGDEFSPSDAQ